MGHLNSQQTDELLREPIISIITTLRADGSPHMTPVWHMVEGDEIVVAVDKRTVKARNVVNNPSVALCVAADESPQRWILVSGTARLSEDGALDFVRAVSAHYLGEEQAGPYVEEILDKRQFALLRITPTSVVGFDGLD